MDGVFNGIISVLSLAMFHRDLGHLTAPNTNVPIGLVVNSTYAEVYQGIGLRATVHHLKIKLPITSANGFNNFRNTNQLSQDSVKVS